MLILTPSDFWFLNSRTGDHASLSIPDDWSFYRVRVEGKKMDSYREFVADMDDLSDRARETLEENGVNPGGEISEDLGRNLGILFEEPDRARVKYLFSDDRRAREAIKKVQGEDVPRFSHIVNESRVAFHESSQVCPDWKREMIQTFQEIDGIHAIQDTGTWIPNTLLLFSGPGGKVSSEGLREKIRSERTESDGPVSVRTI